MRCLKASLDRYSFGNAFKAFFLLSQTLSWAAGPACFDRTGQYFPEGIPCRPSTFQSVCCREDWECLENGLCRTSSSKSAEYPNMYWQGGCTDPKWEASECVHKCPSECEQTLRWKSNMTYSHRTFSDKYTPCGGNSYCCDDCACKNAAMVDIPGRPDAYTTIGVLAPTSSSLITSPVATTTTTIGVLAPTSSSLITSPVAKTTNVPSLNSTNALKIGLGVGLSLAGIILLCAVWYIFKRDRQWERLVKEIRGHLPSREASETPPAQARQVYFDGVPQELIAPNVVTLWPELNCPNDMTWIPEMDSHTGNNLAPELITTAH